MNLHTILFQIRKLNEIRAELNHPQRAMWGEEIPDLNTILKENENQRAHLQCIADNLFGKINQLKTQNQEKHQIQELQQYLDKIDKCLEKQKHI